MDICDAQDLIEDIDFAVEAKAENGKIVSAKRVDPRCDGRNSGIVTDAGVYVLEERFTDAFVKGGRWEKVWRWVPCDR